MHFNDILLSTLTQFLRDPRAMSVGALFEAARKGDLARLRDVLAAGVDVEAWHDGWTTMHWAADCGQTACLEALLAAGASVHSVTAVGSTPLMFASWSGHAACVRALIAAGSDVNRADQYGRMPFYYALRRGRGRALKILLRAGADMHTENVDRHNINTDAWDLVDAIRKVGDWPEYVRCRRATVASVIQKAITHDALPEALNLEIAAFVEPPGGY